MKITLPQFPVEGGCVCGAIRYRLNAAPAGLWACHCKRCQAYAGAYTLSLFVRQADLEIGGVVPVEYSERADSGRTSHILFCPNCHTRMWHRPDGVPDYLVLMAGTLDDTSWVAPAAHIFTRSRQAGTQVAPDAPCFAHGSPGVPALVAAWKAAIA